ncbi:MAG: hypothetical protein HY720_06790 [Planctomycetes bacterium]|nr:hypothetical protein [Planctomycetota bacterium]
MSDPLRRGKPRPVPPAGRPPTPPPAKPLDEEDTRLGDEDEEEILEIDPDDLILEDDPFLEELASGPCARMAPGEIPPAPAPGRPERAGPPPVEELLQDDIEEDSFLEHVAEESEDELAVATEEPGPGSSLDSPSELMALDDEESAEVPRITERECATPDLGRECATRDMDEEATAPPPEPPTPRLQPVSLAPAEWEKRLSRLDAMRVLNDLIKPLRLHTTVPARPLAEAEFRLLSM